jgi:hypothetical protein
LGASSAEDVSHDDFELAERAGGLRTVFKGDVQEVVLVPGYSASAISFR